jgi:hypothetical protein
VTTEGGGDRTGYDAQTRKFWAWCRRCDAPAFWTPRSAEAYRWLRQHDTECEAHR